MSFKKTLFIIFLILIVAGFSLLFLTSQRRVEIGDSPKPGRPVPDFELPDLMGRRVRLSELRGKVVFLNIWASWCRPCIQEMPVIERLHRAMAGRSFIVLAASQDKGGDTEKKVRKLVRQMGLTFAVLLDPENQLTLSYRVTGYPETFIIDKEGILVQRIIGARDWMSPEWVGAITKLAER